MDETWSMEEMGKCIKEKHICSLFGIARSKSPFVGENYYRCRSGLCVEPNRFDTGLHSSHRIHRRSPSIATGHLASHQAHSKKYMAGMSGIGSETNARFTTQSSSCNDHNIHLASSNNWLCSVGLVVRKWYRKHLTNPLDLH